MTIKTLAVLLSLIAVPAISAPLHLEVYNPGEKAIFPVSSTLVSGPKEVVLIDAQFSVKDGQKLADMIKASGKDLTKIIITSGDPDYYFGLEPLVKAFPAVSVVASPAVVEHIRATKDAKLEYWGPKMEEGAPKSIVVPQPTPETSFSVDGTPLELHHSGEYAAYIWIPSEKTILGGTGVASGIHVWTADTLSAQKREAWRNVLTEMKALKPIKVIPGHYLGSLPDGDKAVTFTQDYLVKFENALNKHKSSAEVISEMKEAYPGLADEGSLELSAKVNTGEMKW
ncbi:Vmh family MBL fold metallo-hydrolase [uncultured Cedecea sp.]|uniref:Vmh family MBL fold metallo-hydrolase n=1 Tax=uncultured Cedecea sp. TaxID=988762 RepID=UPI0026156B53|nr:Vmh family MBL fold metallo-hydrolase [uncultured Cedecea sp.]